jgi:uncharacterized protein YndB with AHSA1/START domain
MTPRLRLIAIAVVLLIAAVVGLFFAILQTFGLSGLPSIVIAPLATLPLLVLVLVRSIRVPTVRKHSVRVRAPRELVFAATIDPTRLASWSPHVRSVETEAGRPGEVGFRYRVVARNGRAITVELVAIDPPVRAVTRTWLRRTNVEIQRTYEAEADGTVIHVRQAARQSLLVWMLTRVQGSRLRRLREDREARMVADLERLAAAAPGP